MTIGLWSKWRQEFLQNLQLRQKLAHPQRNLQVNDVLISKEDNGVCNRWPLATVVEVYPSEDGQVKECRILLSDKALDFQGKTQSKFVYMQRPIHTLVLLLAFEDQGL